MRKSSYPKFYRNQMIDIYNIIIDDSIIDKEEAINRLGGIDKLAYSLKTGFYTEIDEELRCIKEWFDKNYPVDNNKKVNKNINKGNQYSDKQVSHKLNDLIYLNRLFMNGLLNENTYYPLFKNMGSSRLAEAPEFKYLLKSNIIDFENPEIKSAFENVDKIEEAVKKFHTGIPFKNLKYRRTIENVLENNNYLDNYKYAEYVLNTYINSTTCYRVRELIDGKRMTLEMFSDCLDIVKFLNPILYNQYLEKKASDASKNLVACNYAFINLAEKIRECNRNNEELDVLEFISNAPFLRFTQSKKSYDYDYGQKVYAFIKEPGLADTIGRYVYRNGINNIKVTNAREYINRLCSINGHELTEEEKKDIYKIMKVLDIIPSGYTINEVAKRYINNLYNMSEINDMGVSQIKPIQLELKNNPYEYKKSK